MKILNSLKQRIDENASMERLLVLIMIVRTQASLQMEKVRFYSNIFNLRFIHIKCGPQAILDQGKNPVLRIYSYFRRTTPYILILFPTILFKSDKIIKDVWLRCGK